MRPQAVGQRPASLEHAQNIEDDEAELWMLGKLARDAEGAIDRDTGIQQGRKLLRKEQNVAPPAALFEARS